MFLTVIAAHSKWIEAHPVSSITSSTTISHLCQIFEQHGLPEVVVTNNGQSFISDEFQKFLYTNGIKHILTSLYYPVTNG